MFSVFKGVIDVSQNYPDNIYLFKVNNRDTRKRCGICSELTIKTYFTPFASISVVEFEQVNVSWVTTIIMWK